MMILVSQSEISSTLVLSPGVWLASAAAGGMAGPEQETQERPDHRRCGGHSQADAPHQKGGRKDCVGIDACRKSDQENDETENDKERFRKRLDRL
jgi:hypothetical protein